MNKGSKAYGVQEIMFFCYLHFKYVALKCSETDSRICRDRGKDRQTGKMTDRQPSRATDIKIR